MLMRIEKENGNPLPESLMNTQQLNVFCVRYVGEQPYHIELLSSYEACISYKEGVVIAVVANSDVVFKEFYQLKQEKNEKVQVFSVRLREALNKLTLRFPDRVPAGDDRILCDCFFYGMKAELKSCVRHLFDYWQLAGKELSNRF